MARVLELSPARESTCRASSQTNRSPYTLERTPETPIRIGMQRQEPPSVLGVNEAVRARPQRSLGSTIAAPFGRAAPKQAAMQGRRVLPRHPPGHGFADVEGDQ
ncbi:unnamed protein product [Peniophora sp. CBMAI 1063]|nr:unnamed protein product [Peniophora sp. CBMAI 1063]